MALDLLTRIKLGEDSIFELKELVFNGKKVAAPHRDSLADEIGAFANSEGGTIILGVADKTREIIGIPCEQLDIVEKWAQEIVRDLIEPLLTVGIFREILEDKALLRIEVPKSIFAPHKSANGYFYRLGSSKREMSTEYLARLFQQRSQSRMIRFDETPVDNTSIKDLSPPLILQLLGSFFFVGTEMNIEADETLLDLAKLHVLSNESKDAKITVAGILMGSRAPQKFLPNAYIQAVCYTGLSRDAAYQIDARDITGPLPAQIHDALHFVKRNMQTPARKILGREDFPQYDLRAVFEAIVNAVAHRDYSIYGSTIRLHMFADRLEISSPGLLSNTMTLDRMPLMQSTRNELIASLLARCKVEDSEIQRVYIMDKRGEGVPLIQKRSHDLSGKEPIYKMVGHELQLTIFAQTKPEEKDSPTRE